MSFFCRYFAPAFAPENGVREWQERGSEKFFEKSFRKIWRLQKNTLPLHHFRANKTARGQKRGGRMIKALPKTERAGHLEKRLRPIK